MTVADLIDALAALPQTATVLVRVYPRAAWTRLVDDVTYGYGHVTIRLDPEPEEDE